MQPVLVLGAALVVALGAAAPGVSRTAAESSVRPVSCATPTLQLVGFAQHHMPVALRTARRGFGLRLQRPVRPLGAVLFDYSGCIDTVVCVVGEPCEPPVQPAPKTTHLRVARIAGVRPRVAVADLRSPNVIYVGRAGVRCLERGRGTSLARCLRAASR